MQAITGQIAAAATDREPIDAPRLRDQLGRWLGSVCAGPRTPDPRTEPAMSALAARLDRSVREATDRLLELHGLSGRAAEEIRERVAGQFETGKRADVAKTGVIGGLVSGALGGLAADLAAGGLTFGAGALIGGILGAIGMGGAAQAYNVAIGAEKGTIGWSAPFLTQRVGAALLRYLAVAHFGRGRGDWVQGGNPPARLHDGGDRAPSPCGASRARRKQRGNPTRAPPDCDRGRAPGADQALRRSATPPRPDPIGGGVLTGWPDPAPGLPQHRQRYSTLRAPRRSPRWPMPRRRDGRAPAGSSRPRVAAPPGRSRFPC